MNKYPNSLAREYDPSDLVINLDLTRTQAPKRLIGSPDIKSPVSPSLRSLEPDQLVWSILDQYYPNGMTMLDAFVIESEDDFQDLSKIKQPQPQQPGKSYYNTYNQPHNTNSLHPNHAALQQSSHSQSSHSGSSLKERSLSPNSPHHISSKSPVSSVHRRSQSNPSHSPTTATAPSNTALSSFNAANNSQAILLLPRNFSLATGSATTLKRRSFDEGSIKEKPLSPVTPLEVKKEIKLPTKAGVQRNNSEEKKKEKPKIKPLVKSKTPAKDDKKPTKAKSTTDKVLPSISVLVVEDNAINQAILGAFLRKHKMHYQIAKNGQEAVDKWKKGGFHLVIMDLQLPVKSGLEATKEIRYLERINKIGMFAEHELYLKYNKNALQIKDEDRLDLNIFISPVIIVALTASSNSSADRKHALMAGCNDYLTKPVNLLWLQNKITEWGCMQALINFDGWKQKRLAKESIETEAKGISTRG